MTSHSDKTMRDFAQDLKGPAAAEEWRGNWAIALLYRWPGVILAWLCAKLGMHPKTVTLIAFVLAASLPVQATYWPLAVAPWAVCFSAMLFQVLDCTDGTLARLTQQTSKSGGDMDFLVDMAQWALLYVAIGMLADRTFESGFMWTTIGAIAAWARLMARVIRDRLNSSVNDGPREIKITDVPSLFLGGISGLIPVFALAGAWLHWALIALLIYSLLDVIEGLIPLFRK